MSLDEEAMREGVIVVSPSRLMAVGVPLSPPGVIRLIFVVLRMRRLVQLNPDIKLVH